MNTNPTADSFFSKAEKWKQELLLFRRIVLECGLTETIKWGQPVYTNENKNIVLINGFKDKCVLGFFKGSLLADKKGMLTKQGEHSQSARIFCATDANTISKQADTLKAYIREAIAIEESGKKISVKDISEITIPKEFENRLKTSPALKNAFNKLTPGRQRAYLMFIGAAKQSETRESRIDQYTKRILDGKGLNDCICGLSKKMPGCDGSHKYANSEKKKN